jgi:hypothetical protein
MITVYVIESLSDQAGIPYAVQKSASANAEAFLFHAARSAVELKSKSGNCRKDIFKHAMQCDSPFLISIRILYEKQTTA